VFNNFDGVSSVLDPGSTIRLNDHLMNLNDGVYTLRFVNEGSQPVTINWVLKIARLDWEKIVNNGVSQTFALALDLFSTNPTGSENETVASVGSTPAGITLGAVNASAGSIGPISGGMFVTLNTGLMGQPTLESQSLAVIGPAVEAGSTALADSGNNNVSNWYGSAINWSAWVAHEDNLVEVEAANEQAVLNDMGVVQPRAVAGVPARLDPEAEGARADDRALGQAQWLVQLGTRLQRLVMSATAADNTSRKEAALLLSDAQVQNSPASMHKMPTKRYHAGQKSSAVQADLGAAACVILVSAAACRLRRPLLNWLRVKNRLGVQSQKLVRMLHQGPHRSLLRARAITQTGKLRTMR
jgi:hypothetical protein